MDGDVGAGVAAGDPLGELAAADRLRLQQRAVAVVDVLQHAVGDERAQLLVVGVGELVIDDLGQHAVLARPARCSSSSSCERQDRRLLDQDVLAGVERVPGRRRSGGRPAWRRRRHRRRARAARRPRRARRSWRTAAIRAGGLRGSARPALPVRLATAASSTSTRPKSRRYSPSRVQLLEERAVGLVEDHPQADHAGPEAVWERVMGCHACIVKLGRTGDWHT